MFPILMTTRMTRKLRPLMILLAGIEIFDDETPPTMIFLAEINNYVALLAVIRLLVETAIAMKLCPLYFSDQGVTVELGKS